jgi:signal transduction histidine kinase
VTAVLDLLDALELPAITVRGGSLEDASLNPAANALLGHAWLTRVHPADVGELERAFRTAAVTSSSNFRFTTDNLKFREVHVELRRRDGVTFGVLTETTTKESGEPQLEALLEALPFEVWERDEGGVLVRQNVTALRNRGAKLGGTVDTMGIAPEVADLWNDLNARAFRGEIVSTPVDYTDPTGRRFAHIHIIAPVRDGDRIRGIVGVNVDITAVKAAEAERDALHSRLIERDRLAALGELAAVVAHEVRNPLAAIYNSISTLKRHVALDGDAAVLFRVLEEEAVRLNHTVDDLLNYVRPLEPQRRIDDLVVLARGVLRQQLESRPEARTIASEVVAPVPIEPVLVDPVLMRIALSNLVTNALQAMPDGGKLTVSVRDENVANRPTVTVAVHDTGRGIEANILDRVFEPFFTTRPSGSGLGLAVVRRIVQAHNGAVTAESGERGTVFTMHLPR